MITDPCSGRVLMLCYYLIRFTLGCTTATTGGESNCVACSASASDTVACTVCGTDYELFQSSDAEKCGRE